MYLLLSTVFLYWVYHGKILLNLGSGKALNPGILELNLKHPLESSFKTRVKFDNAMIDCETFEKVYLSFVQTQGIQGKY